jgi:branched-chain amino acid transport system ATP-binding protein
VGAAGGPASCIQRHAGAAVSALLDVAGLTRRFGGLTAVADLSFTVQPGEILGIIGPNGAGKTTAVSLISGAIRPSAGRVTFDGKDVTGRSPNQLVRRGLVRTFQSTAVYAASTVEENARRGAYLQMFPGVLPALLGTQGARRKRQSAEARVAELLDWLGLSEVAHDNAASLPYGYQKTLGMVIALAAEPRLLMLDEPVAGLSAEETDHVRDVIHRVRSRGIAVLVIDHNMRFMSGLCDRVLVLHHGQELAQGKPADVLSNPAVIDAYLGHGHGAARHH